MFTGYLIRAERRKLEAWAIRNGLAGQRDQLMRDIDPTFSDSIKEAEDRAGQLRNDIEMINRTRKLTDDTIPFDIWLDNACAVVHQVESKNYIQDIISKVRGLARDDILSHEENSLAEGVFESLNNERVFGKSDLLDNAFLQNALETAKSVFHIKVFAYEGGRKKTDSGGHDIGAEGTGWLIAENMVITNLHVLDARETRDEINPDDLERQIENCEIRMGYITNAILGQKIIGGKLIAKSRELDYAIITISEPTGTAPLKLFNDVIEISEKNYQSANIIQHPDGNARKLALRNNLIVGTSGKYIAYFTDTKGGSSGSPVCNDDWEVVALHASEGKSTNTIMYQGHKHSNVNLGIRIDLIRDDLIKNNREAANQIGLI